MIDTNSRFWWGLPLFCVLVLLWLLHAELVLTNTIPASYDLTGHILPIAELKYRLLPQMRLHGWSADWFAGFPLFYFYFPLPALLTVVLSLVLSLESALKVSSTLGLLAFPFAAYALFRALTLPRAQAAIAATVTATFLLMQSFWFLGGNIASTVAGEYAFSISFTLSLFYLATLLRVSDRPISFVVPALLLAAIVLSHLVTTIVVVAVSAVLLTEHTRRRTILLSWIVAFLLSAFWTIPFLLRHGEMPQVYAHATRSLSELMPTELWPVLPGAIVGIFLCRHYRRALPLLYLTLGGLVLYLVAGGLVYPGRFLPYWYLGLHMLAGFATASALRADRRTGVALLVLSVLPLLYLNVVRGTGYLRDWSGGAYGGLQQRESWPELQKLFQQLQQEVGRVYWEQAPERLSALGSRNLAAVTPYVAQRSVVNGLWLESSQLHDELIAIDSAVARAHGDVRELDRALAKLNALGATRLIALTPATAQLLAGSGLQLQYTSQNYAVFRLPGRPLVESTAPAEVQLLEWSDERVRFRTTLPGTPHLVRMSWFPNWRASGASLERGADGMMLVTPQRNDVEMRFQRTAVEVVGTLISLIAVVGLVAAVVRTSREKRS